MQLVKTTWHDPEPRAHKHMAIRWAVPKPEMITKELAKDPLENLGNVQSLGNPGLQS